MTDHDIQWLTDAEALRFCREALGTNDASAIRVGLTWAAARIEGLSDELSAMGIALADGLGKTEARGDEMKALLGQLYKIARDPRNARWYIWGLFAKCPDESRHIPDEDRGGDINESQPPIDNDHVAPGCELFSDEVIALNKPTDRTTEHQEKEGE
jgi:hypothetical protein